MKQNKKQKQTLESAQYGLEISFKALFPDLKQLYRNIKLLSHILHVQLFKTVIVSKTFNLSRKTNFRLKKVKNNQKSAILNGAIGLQQCNLHM